MTLKRRVRLDYEVDGEDRNVEAVYSAIDVRAWEGVHNESALVADLSVSMLTWLGHHAAVRQGLLDGPLKEWQAFNEVCTSVEGVRDTETDPTEPPKGSAATPKTPGADSSVP